MRQQVVRELQNVLAARNLGRVQPAVDVDERFSLLGQTMRVGIRQAVRMREPLRDLAILLDVGQVLRARHEGEVPRMPVRRPSRLDQREPIACRVELPEVVDRLVVSGELVVVPWLEPERRFGCGY